MKQLAMRREVVYPCRRSDSCTDDVSVIVNRERLDRSHRKLVLDAEAVEQDVRLQFAGLIDLAGLRTKLGISNLSLQAAVIVECRASRFTRMLWQQLIPPGIPVFELDQVMTLPVADSIVRRCKVEFVIAAAETKPNDDPAAPQRNGQVVSRQTYELICDPGGREFPVQWQEFHDFPDALWKLNFDPNELNLESAAPISLWLNSRHHVFHDLLARSNPKLKPIRSALVKAIRAEVVTSLLQETFATVGEAAWDSDEPTQGWDVVLAACRKLGADQWDDDDLKGSYRRLARQYVDRPALLQVAVADALGTGVGIETALGG